MKKILLIFATLLFFACTDESNAQRTLENFGFTNISFTGHDWWSCGEDDSSSTGFIATNKDGKRVSGTVCCGMIFKNCTVRF